MFEFLLSPNPFLNLRVRHCADRSRLGSIAEVHSAADTTYVEPLGGKEIWGEALRRSDCATKEL